MEFDYTPLALNKILKEICQPLTKEQRNYLISNLTIQEFKKNEIIYNEGELPVYMMCLLSGKIKICKDGISGRSQIMRIIKPVDFFGFSTYFCEARHLTSAIAFEPSIVGFIPLNSISKLIEDNSLFALFFIKKLSLALNIADCRTVSLTQKHIRGRLAEAILSLYHSYGVENDGSTLNIYVSREDLANMSNMTTSNAIRTLSSFASEGLVAVDGRKIKLCKLDELQRISAMG